jgi:predicted RNA-binding Zn ribbon-like protein
MVNDQSEVPPLHLGDDRKPAPGELTLVQGFVNTLEPDEDREDLPDPATLQRWLAHYGLMSAGADVCQADFEQAIRVREALRAVLKVNNGAPEDAAAIDTLNGAAKTAELLVRFEGDGGTRLEPMRGGVDGAIARLLAIVHQAQADGHWERFKVCPDDGCGWAFYDWSKNRSATWCSMETCGNRAKARAYRERHRDGTHSH